MSAAQPEVQVSLTQKDMRAFPRKVRDLVLDLVNNYSVRFRLQDGGHILLYAADTTVPAYKVSASRSEETMLTYMSKWVANNITGYGEKAASTPPVPAKTAGATKTAAKKPVSEIGRQLIEKATATPQTKQPERNWLVNLKGRKSNYLYWDGEADHSTLHCVGADGVPCDYTSTTRRGVHLHEAGHTGLASVRASQGNKVKQAKRAEREAEADAPVQTEPVEAPVEQPVAEQAPVAPPPPAEELKEARKEVLRKRAEAPPAEETPSEKHAAEVLAQAEADIRKIEALEAITVLAGHYGVTVGGTSEAEVRALRDKITEQQSEIDNLNAKLQLIREATGL